MAVDEPLRHSLEAAAQPKLAEILRAKEAILAELSPGQELETRLLRASVRALLNGEGDRFARIQAPHGEPASAPDPEHPALRVPRVESAINEAIAQLSAEMLLEPVQWNSNPEISLQVEWPVAGRTEEARIHVPEPVTAAAYRLSRRHLQRQELNLLDLELATEGLADLLGPRGVRSFGEGVTAFRYGLFLAAGSLVGAASEAAWFRIGEGLRSVVPGVETVMAADQVLVGTLIKRLCDHFRQQRFGTRVEEVFAHSTYLRSIRNYGVHPGSDLDPEQEAIFTEASCYLLLVTSRRYLLQLRQMAEDAGIGLIKTTATLAD